MTTAIMAPNMQQQGLIESYWQIAFAQVQQGITDIILPYTVVNDIGLEGINTLTSRYRYVSDGCLDNYGGEADILYSIAIRAAAQGHIDPFAQTVHITPALVLGTQGTSSVITDAIFHVLISYKTWSPAQLLRKPKARRLLGRANPRFPVRLTLSFCIARTGTLLSKPRILGCTTTRSVSDQKNKFVFHEYDADCPKAKILGRKWQEEDEGTKAAWKSKADVAKEKHLVDHPGYQYQPRKPSEKKRRMTKRKAAALRAASQNPMTPPTMNGGASDEAGEPQEASHAANDFELFSVNAFCPPVESENGLEFAAEPSNDDCMTWFQEEQELEWSWDKQLRQFNENESKRMEDHSQEYSDLGMAFIDPFSFASSE